MFKRVNLVERLDSMAAVRGGGGVPSGSSGRGERREAVSRA